MARKRKTEVKASDKKEQAKPLAVRKSSRQRMKKQLEEDVNGETVSTNVNSEDCKYSDNDNSQESTKKEKAVPKKATRHKNLVGKEKSTTKCKSVHGESSNDQDNVNVDSDQMEKEKTDEKQILVSENVLNEVVWPEDVIEETIICEEMEVDGEVSDHCSVAQDGNIVLEQVLLVNDSNFEGKDIVEYTLIQTDSPAEPHRSISSDHNMECTPTLDDSCKSSNSYEVIEQGLSILHMSDTNATFNESKSITESGSFDNNQINTNFCDKEGSRSLRRSGRGTRVKKTNNQTVSETSVKKRTESCNKKNTCSSEDKEKSIKAIKNNSVTSIKVNETNNTQSSLLPSRSILLAQEDDNSSSMSEKTDNSQEVTSVLTNDLLKDNKFVNNSLILEQKNVSNIDSKTNLSTLVTSKNLLLTSEEHSRDSELDTKVDSEDTKASSSSENSNDTLLSSNSSKNSDINSDKKSLFNQLNETDKKSGFRSRSGSTDTTESENGSNSSGVRRSSRIRTIGLMKPRSRGRGLVTKPSVDSVKTTVQQERDKFISNIVGSNQEKSQNRDGLDNLSETSQSDKENNSNKTIVSQDILTPLTPANGGSTTSGYDSDSNKPVKVKSRWRRSSELEMGNSESWSTARANLNFPNSIVTGISTVVPSFVNDTSMKLPSLPVNLSQEIKGTENQDLVSVSSQSINPIDSSSSTIAVNSMLTCENTSSLIPSVGAKMFLPMVSSVEDREMEERLSQFEHLKENLYLTERYTNKETKRMLCDCFLTDEEILRGELGCGEDCLNRLLMIECGPRCVVGDRCTNKRFQNCEYADCEVFRTEKKGFGLRAKTNLNAGDFIMEYVGEVVNPKDFRRRAKEYSKDKNRHYYFMALKSDQIIDATMKGNVSRFINHSCDPNAETQKWTVNGELRIGFFIKKFVVAGEEITFDYHFQRYGKEAQKCFCEATNCRGWIGDNPEENKEKTDLAEEFDDEEEEESEDETEDTAEDKEDDKENKDKKPRRQVRKKKAEKKVSDHMEDEDLEEQVDKLCATGLKNRAHTLTLSRLMVRSREIQHRTRLLKVIQSGEQPCRRLFLDYHGLRLMWSYMMDVAGSATEEAHQFRLEVIKTLSTLPIPNKTMLIDSKVLSVIEKWSKQVFYSSSGDSPEDDQTKSKLSKEDVAMVVDSDNFEKLNAESTSDLSEMKKPLDMDVKTEIKEETVDPNLISELANNLLLEWSNLKEVFRIPKKERIEQMKEHEREADRGYKENVEKESKENNFYDRYRSERRNEAEKRLDRLRRGRDSPDFEHTRSKEKRGLEERPNLVPVPRMSKFERRQLFAMKVAKEEEERQRRQHEDLWQQHETQCIALGLDPYTTAAVDTQTGYPLFFNPQLAQWQAYPIQDGSTPEALGQHCPTGTAMFVSASGTSAGATSGNVELVYPAGYTTVTTTGTPPIQVQNGSAAIPVVAGAAATATPISQQIETEVEPELLPPPPLDLPPKWKWARDKRGRLYYYHVKERVPQWLPPPPDHIAVQPDSSTSSESSEESSSSNDEEDDSEQQPPTQQQQPFATANQQEHVESMELDKFEPEVPNLVPETKKRRDGLVQERIISPRREEDRVDHKKYKEIKEKLRRQKERAKLKEHLEKIKKHRRSSKSKSYSKHNTSKFQTITSDMSPTTERKIKDTFRINMAEVMVHFLNPYRKSDCKQGRITNTEDFKHLARKLTHFVLAKELKHCKSVDELECNDNVKHKAKDFVRKYMSKYGAVYQKSTDED